MPTSPVSPRGRNLDRRVTTIEQILPTLATKEDLNRFATKEDLKQFATKEDLKQFPTLAYLERRLSELSTEIRRHFDVVTESLRDEIRVTMEGYGWLNEKVTSVEREAQARDAGLDRRLTRLEAERRRPRRR